MFGVKDLIRISLSTIQIPLFGSILGSVAGPVIGSVVNGIFGGGGGGGGQPQSANQQINTAPLATGAMGQNAFNQASNIQATGSTQAINTLNNANNTVGQINNPYVQAGNSGIAGLQNTANGGGQFSMADMGNVMPAYTFALDAAQGAINNASAVGGTQLSSGNLSDLAQTSAGIASQYEGQAFNQWAQQKAAQQAAQGALLNAGQGAVGRVGQAAMSTGQQVAGEQTGLANAQAYNTVAGTDRLAGGINNTFNQPGVQGALNSAGQWVGNQIGNVFGMNGGTTSYNGTSYNTPLPSDPTSANYGWTTPNNGFTNSNLINYGGLPVSSWGG
jgi:hypothetical protein